MRLYWGLLPFLLGLAACNPDLSQVDTASSLPPASKVTHSEDTTASNETIEQGDAAALSRASKARFPEFTTEGKPTRTIETPWGARELYDPAQDQEIITEFSDFPKREFKIAVKARRTQLRSLIPMGCVVFEDYSAKFGVDDFKDCDISNHTNKLDSFSTKMDCLVAYTGLYRHAIKPPICQTSIFYPENGGVKRISRANPEFDNFPMQDRCFTDMVRVNCLKWDADD